MTKDINLLTVSMETTNYIIVMSIITRKTSGPNAIQDSNSQELCHVLLENLPQSRSAHCSITWGMRQSLFTDATEDN